MKIIFYFLVSLPLLVFASADLLISEIMYDPKGNDIDREWLEIVNISGNPITIVGGSKGWRINDGKDHLFVNAQLTIIPGETSLIVQNKAKFLSEHPSFQGKLIEANFVLKNSQSSINIKDENKNVRAVTEYNHSAGGNDNDYSLVFDNGSWRESNFVGGQPGIYPDQTRPIKENPVSQEVSKPMVSNQPTTTEPVKFATKTESNISNVVVSSTQEKIKKSKPDYSGLLISEFLPNPEGRDTTEFIELQNSGQEPISLEGLKLKVGTKSIKLQGQINGGSYMVLHQTEYHFNIKNSGDTLRLEDDQGNLIFEIRYKSKAPIGKSFSRNDNGKWQWTNPTPGQANRFDFTIVDGRRETETIMPVEAVEAGSLQPLSQIKQNFPAKRAQSNLFSSPLLVGLIIAIAGSAVVLFLRR